MKEGHKYWIVMLATIFLGMIFIVAGAGKLFAQSDSFSPLLFSGIVVLPYIEVAIGLLLILGIAILPVTGLSALLIAGFMASNLYMINLGIGANPCNSCFGYFGSLTAVSSLILDGIMAFMVLAILFCYRGKFLNLMPWFLTPVQSREYEREEVTKCLTH